MTVNEIFMTMFLILLFINLCAFSIASIGIMKWLLKDFKEEKSEDKE